MSFTIEQTRMLSDCDRKMDSGEINFVISRGERMAVSDEVMQELGLVKGQTVSAAVTLSILELSLAHVLAKIAMKNASEASK